MIQLAVRHRLQSRKRTCQAQVRIRLRTYGLYGEPTIRTHYLYLLIPLLFFGGS